MYHNFTYIGNLSNPLVAMYTEVDQASNNFLTYSILIIAVAVAFGVVLRKTQDITKAGIMSMYIGFLLSTLLYFAGKGLGIPFMADVVYLVLAVVLVFSIALQRFMSSNQGK